MDYAIKILKKRIIMIEWWIYDCFDASFLLNYHLIHKLKQQIKQLEKAIDILKGAKG